MLNIFKRKKETNYPTEWYFSNSAGDTLNYVRHLGEFQIQIKSFVPPDINNPLILKILTEVIE